MSLALIGQGHELRLGLVDKGIPKDTGQSCLALWNPPRIVLSHGVFVITEQIGDVGDRYAFLQQNPGERVPEPVRSGSLLELAGEVENPVNFSTP
jgi:hypothetical protein